MRGLKPAAPGAGSAVPLDAVIQVGRVVASSVSPKTAVTLYNVEGIGAVDRTDAAAPTSDEADSAGETVGDAELFGALGLIGRPLPPTKSRGRVGYMEVVAVRTADGLVPIAARDTRLNAAYPNPAPGDIIFAGYGSNFVKLAADGTIAIATTVGGVPDGAMAQVQLRGDGFQLVGPWGKLVYDEKGFHLLHYSGSRIDLGGIGLPAPFGDLGLSTYATLSAAVVSLKASAVTLGNGLLPEPAAKALALQIVLAAIATALPLVGTALTTIAGALVPPSPAAVTAAATAATSLGLAASAIGTGAATIPSASTSVT